MKRALVVFGTRPEAIKLAPVVRELRQRSSAFTTIVCSTGQHREMLQQVLDMFEIVPDVDLRIMSAQQTLNAIVSNVLARFDALLEQTTPDVLIVQGDTSTAMAAAMAAFHRRVRVAHVEAGLRTDDIHSPFPEELNRRIVGTMADLHFTPTKRATDALLREGVPAGRIHQTGNTVVDALRLMTGRLGTGAALPCGLDARIGAERLVLVTGHRRESFGKPFESICDALLEIARRLPDIHIVYPVHLNPNVREVVHQRLGGQANVHLIDPVPYDVLLTLLRRSTIVLTDSGGIQEEAPSFAKPVLVMREVTERPEGVEAGVARLVGTDRKTIVETALRLLTDEDAHAAMCKPCSPYGDGFAAQRIADVLARDGEK